MITPDIIRDLEERYPGKKIITLPAEDPKEVICEVDVTPEKSVAIAVIDKSAPHFHRIMTETYRMVKGVLLVTMDGEQHLFLEGETCVITPGIIHHAEGNAAEIEVTCVPAWTPEDHILV